jgi:uroporphyrinogen decarboxylase
MLGRCVDFAITLSEHACSLFPLDWLWTGDDIASQLSMFMSPATWRTLIKPHLARLFEVGKKHNLWVAYHCCGTLRPIIPDLIEIGMDVLNPVQGNCPGMDPLALKAEFGENLAFMGGLDTQDMLPNGSVGEVQRETARLIEGMTTGGGGYILAASHTIPPETPDEKNFAKEEQGRNSKEKNLQPATKVRKHLGLSGTKV